MTRRTESEAWSAARSEARSGAGAISRVVERDSTGNKAIGSREYEKEVGADEEVVLRRLEKSPARSESGCRIAYREHVHPGYGRTSHSET